MIYARRRAPVAWGIQRMTDDATGGTEHTVSQGDVSVHRVIETDGTGVVASVDLRSAADEPVLVEVVEELPDDLPVESRGFKPEAMPDGKSVSDDRLVLEQAVADESEEVVYGLMLSEPVERVSFDAPAIETVEPVAAGASATEDDDRVDESDVEAADTADGAKPGDTAADGSEDGDEAADGDDKPMPSLSNSNGSAIDIGVDESDSEPETVDGSDSEPETGDDHEREGIADDTNERPGQRSVDVRLDRLSARVEEFAAYAEALGTLVDEHGTPPEFVDRFDERIDELDDQVTATRAEFRDDADEISSAVEDVEEDVGELETDVAAVGDETDALRDDVDALNDELAALRTELDAVSTSMEHVREETATLREELRELQAVHGSLAESLAGWASSSTDGVESGAEADADTDGTSVVSDGGTAPEEDLDDEYTSVVTPVDSDD